MAPRSAFTRRPSKSTQTARGGTHALQRPEQVRRFFAARAKQVLSFAGFGELGYDDDGIVERIVGERLRGLDPEAVIVNCGTLLRAGGQDGIARALAVAKAMGIETSGIHPGVALAFAATHRVSPHEDHAFFVDDASWGGLQADGRPSPTLQLILDVSDELVVIGGGKHAADELRAFHDRGTKLSYHPARMNARATQEWCTRARVDVGDPRGAAYGIWCALQRER